MSRSDEMQQWLDEAKSVPLSVSQPYVGSTCIFSAPRGLLNEYEDAYVPRIVSIGPYHFGKQELREMEIFKGEAVRRELVRIQNKTGRSDFSFNQVIGKIFGEVNQIMRCYDKDIPYDADVLCWMMARDACFILEFFRCYISQVEEADRLVVNYGDFQFRDPWHPIFGLQSENHVVKSEIMRDLIKLENQIPLFVLEEVLAMEEGVDPSVLVLMKEVVKAAVVWEEDSCIQRLKNVMEEVSSMTEASCIERLKKVREEPPPSYIERLKIVMEEASSITEISCIERLKKDIFYIERLKNVSEEVSSMEETSYIKRLKEVTKEVSHLNPASSTEMLKVVEKVEEACYDERREKAKSRLQKLLKAVFDKIYYRPFKYCANGESPTPAHILDIYCHCCLGEEDDPSEREDNPPRREDIYCYCCLRREEDPPGREDNHNELEEPQGFKVPSAVQLNDGGVKIQANNVGRVEDVGFKGRTLSIPRIQLDVQSEIFLRNLIALEICSPYGSSKRMTAFAQLMNELCQTEEGIGVMREKGVIVGNLEPSRILQLWNSLKSSNLTHFQPKYHSIHTTRENLMKGYTTNRSIVCRTRWNEYVGSKKWLVIGGIGATFVLVLTMVQVLCLLTHCPGG